MQLSYRDRPHKKIEIFKLPSGVVDVFLRRNEKKEVNDENETQYVAEEAYFQSSEELSIEYIEKNFNSLWNKAENPPSLPTYEDRVGYLEQDNAMLFYDLALKDNRIETLEQQNAELIYMIMMGAM